MPKAIVFDFDGVIVDSEPLHHRAFLRVLAQYGIQFDYHHYLAHYVGYDDRDGFRAMLARWPQATGSATCDRDTTVARLCQEKAEAFASIVAQGFEPVPGVLEFIGHANPQRPLAIASGATRQDVALFLDKLGLAKHFHPIVTADDVKKSKPHPATYQLAVKQLASRLPELAVMPDDCVAIEDTPAGIQSALAAGLKTVGIATTHRPQQLSGAGRIIESFEGLSVGQLDDWFG